MKIERQNELNENFDAIQSLKTHVQWSNGRSIMIVTCPEFADFNKCGLRLKEIIQEIIKGEEKDQDIQVIHVKNLEETEEIGAEEVMGIHARYAAIKNSSEQGDKRITIWIAPRPIEQGQANALAELQSVIAQDGIEIVLAPNTINQTSAWIDFWHRKVALVPIFE